MAAGRPEHRPGTPARGSRARVSALETWLWTGPVGHLVAGALDVAQGLSGYLLRRAAQRARRQIAGLRAR